MENEARRCPRTSAEQFTRLCRTSPTLKRLISSSTDLWRTSEVGRVEHLACSDRPNHRDDQTTARPRRRHGMRDVSPFAVNRLDLPGDGRSENVSKGFKVDLPTNHFGTGSKHVRNDAIEEAEHGLNWRKLADD